MEENASFEWRLKTFSDTSKYTPTMKGPTKYPPQKIKDPVMRICPVDWNSSPKKWTHWYAAVHPMINTAERWISPWTVPAIHLYILECVSVNNQKPRNRATHQKTPVGVWSAFLTVS